MFICDPCHIENDVCPTKGRHLSGSVGSCEMCGKTAECHDCRIHHHPNYDELVKARDERRKAKKA